MPFDITIGAQIPAIEVAEPRLVSVTTRTPVSLYDSARGQKLRGAPLQKDRVAWSDLGHRCALRLTSDEGHPKAVEVLRVVSPFSARRHDPGCHRISILVPNEKNSS